MYLRLRLIAAGLALAVYLLRRVAATVARDPRWRYLLSRMSLQLVRIFLLRYGLTLLVRAFRLLRFFR